MNTFAALGLLILATTAAVAEPWHGTFSRFDPAEQAEAYGAECGRSPGDGTGSQPLRITRPLPGLLPDFSPRDAIGLIGGADHACAIRGQRYLSSMDGWLLAVSCIAGGQRYSLDTMVRPIGGIDGFLVYPGREVVRGDAPPVELQALRIYRCPTG
jgi:hypothetical protein